MQQHYSAAPSSRVAVVPLAKAGFLKEHVSSYTCSVNSAVNVFRPYAWIAGLSINCERRRKSRRAGFMQARQGDFLD